MGNKKMLNLSIIVNVVFLLITCIFISGDKNIIREKQVIKEMTTSALEEDLNAQITQLNKSHTDYANSIEESKKKIASAITEKGVTTSSDVTLDTMAENIKSIENNANMKTGVFIPTVKNEVYSIELGFRPKVLMIMSISESWACTYYINTVENIIHENYSGYSDNYDWDDITITDTGFEFSLIKHGQSGNQLNKEHHYIAF